MSMPPDSTVKAAAKAPSKPAYLDHAATTPVHPDVLDAMLPYFGEQYGNAASRNHRYGWVAAEAVDIARERVAALIGATPREIVFTSGATESLNLAIKGMLERYRNRSQHLVTCTTEHRAVLDTCAHAKVLGASITQLGVDANGQLDLDELEESIRDDTAAVILMAGNNETGVRHPLAAISALAREKGALFICDATQAVGKVPVDVNADGIDLLACSAHKFYGPKGCGALFVRRRDPRVQLAALLDGGGHERGFRSGTLNVPGIVGMGAAAAMVLEGLSAEGHRLTALRDRLEQRAVNELGALVNGASSPRLPHISNLQFPGRKAERVLSRASGKISASTASACSSADLAPSHVLLAMGLAPEEADASLRLSLGRNSDEGTVDLAIEALRAALAQRGTM
jgi:cysteine desulfurase